MCDLCGYWTPSHALATKGHQVVLCSRCHRKVTSATVEDITFVCVTFGTPVVTTDELLEAVEPDPWGHSYG